MTEEAKARELLLKFIEWTDSQHTQKATIYAAKQCALIAVDEILKIERLYINTEECVNNRYNESNSVDYWEGVKQSINKL